MSIKDRLKQSTFSSPHQEAALSVMVCSDLLIRNMEELTAPFGITSAQYNVLRILRGVYPNGHPRREIIERMVQAAPDVTRLIDRLEKQDLVRRGKSDNDKRLSLTFITEKGLGVLAQIQPLLDAMNNTVWKNISEDEALALAKLCDKLAGSV